MPTVNIGHSTYSTLRGRAHALGHTVDSLLRELLELPECDPEDLYGFSKIRPGCSVYLCYEDEKGRPDKKLLAGILSEAHRYKLVVDGSSGGINGLYVTVRWP